MARERSPWEVRLVQLRILSFVSPAASAVVGDLWRCLGRPRVGTGLRADPAVSDPFVRVVRHDGRLLRAGLVALAPGARP
jgi:hypothetical protein